MNELYLLGLGRGPLFEALRSPISYMHESILPWVVLQLMAKIFPSGVVTLLVHLENTQSFESVLSW
jgi:hypothetical protein